MRDYIYIWNNPEEKFFVASGVLFSDFAEAMGDAGGYLLIEHYSDVAKHDMKSGFDYVSRDETSA